MSYAKGLLVILLAVAGILHGVWIIFDAGRDAGETKVRLEYTGKENKELKKLQAATAAAQAKNNQLSGDLAAAQADIRNREKAISKLRNQYETLAQRGNLCNLTIGSILLHNSSLGYEYDPGQLNGAGQAISTVTGSAFIEHCNGLATQFELQRKQLNKLIEAVK